MAENNKKQKELSPDEQRALIVKNSLEMKLLQGALGSNLVRNDSHKYGQLGVRSAEKSYEETFFSEDAQKEKNEMYQSEKKEGDRLGVFGDPTFPSHYDLSVKLIKQFEEVSNLAKISELFEYSKAVGADLDFEVPEELKKYSKQDLILKAHKGNGKIDVNSLSDSEKVAWNIHEVLTEAYRTACAKNSSQSNYFEEINNNAKAILNQYNKKRE